MSSYGYLLPTRGAVLSSDDSETLAAKTDSDVLDLASRAESMGMEHLWVGDSVLAKPRLEPLTTLAAVARETESARLGTAVYLPTLRDPVHVAHMTASVDQLSGGRLGLGIGVGIGPVVQAEYENLGYEYRRRGRRMDELLDVVTALWDGEAVEYDGEFVQVSDASIGFGPVDDVPIYIPTAAFDPSEGFPRSIRERLLEHGSGWLPIGISPETYRSSLEEIRSLMAEHGRNPDRLDPAFYLDVVIDDDEDAALQTAREFYDRYYPAWDTLSDEDIRARGAFGPPETVADTLAAYDDAGVETMIVRFTTPAQRTQLKRFAQLTE